MKYIPVIGLEIHVELNTKSKMFCQCSANYFGKAANSNTCPVCLGMPGALPVPNEEAIKWTMLIGKALNCTINKVAKFDRKHYFYPDLPKGYQVSQYDEPIAVNGFIELGPVAVLIPASAPPASRDLRAVGIPFVRDTQQSKRRFRIHRVHLEEDTGKLMHSGQETLVDFNRSGVPLVEIVTEADFDNSEDVKEFLQELHTTIEYLNVSDADMEKGSMRLEPNISVRSLPAGKAGLKSEVGSQKFELPNYKVEVKNINSFNFVKKAIDYEVKRHIEILERGETPVQETRGFVEADSSTKSQRTKEEAQDYRYFPEPDIPPFSSDKFLKSLILPELPGQKVERYLAKFSLRRQEAVIITRKARIFKYFESLLKLIDPEKNRELPQKLANALLNKKFPMSLPPEEFIKKFDELSRPKETNMAALETSINRIIEVNGKVVEDIRKGKETAIMFLVGQVMREMKGQADAKTVITKLKAQISKETK